jgi:hypothetical protein
MFLSLLDLWRGVLPSLLHCAVLYYCTVTAASSPRLEMYPSGEVYPWSEPGCQVIRSGFTLFILFLFLIHFLIVFPLPFSRVRPWRP